MLFYKSYNILRKLFKISKKLELQMDIIPVVSFISEKIIENRIIFNIINKNDSKNNNIIYDNLKYICKELDIKIKTDKVEIIRDISFSFDFERNIYKVYYSKHESNNIEKVIKVPIMIYKVVKTNKSIYYNSFYKTKNNLKKYKFLSKYNDIINFNNYEYSVEKRLNNKIYAVCFKVLYDESEVINDDINLIKNLFNNFNINNDKYESFMNKYGSKNIAYIGFSKDRVNLYLI